MSAKPRLPAVLVLPMLLVGFVSVTLIETQGRRPPFQSKYSTIESVQLTQSALGLQREQEELKRELADLRAQLDAIQEQAARANRDARQLQERVDELKAVAGLTPISGPGVVVTLDDAHLPPSRDSRLVAPAIVHSQDITDVLNVAWKAGAQAIAVNGERITGASACVGATIQINGTLMSPPFEIAIVGPVDRLRQLLDSPAELTDLHARQRAFGLRFDIVRAEGLRLPAYTGAIGIRYASVR